jgi:hypothetical protein
MAISIIKKEDTQQFITQVLENIKDLFHAKTNEHKSQLKTSGVKKMNILSGTLQNLRINGTISYSKVWETFVLQSWRRRELLTNFKLLSQ